jgi:hypothetical protein
MVERERLPVPDAELSRVIDFWIRWRKCDFATAVRELAEMVLWSEVAQVSRADAHREFNAESVTIKLREAATSCYAPCWGITLFFDRHQHIRNNIPGMAIIIHVP